MHLMVVEHYATTDPTFSGDVCVITLLLQGDDGTKMIMRYEDAGSTQALARGFIDGVRAAYHGATVEVQQVADIEV